MSKGNMLLGYARGSIGDVVMSRVKGQQVAKARNRKPTNPKTKSQMQQRASFISPVKFYTHGVQALFKFAFSDKKITESNFNAFQRNNAKASFPVTKAENESTGFPALGNFMMTKGKLPEIHTVKLEDFPNGNFLAVPKIDGQITIGKLSKAMIDAGYAEEGDVITFVSIDENVAECTPESLVLMSGKAPVWTIDQFVVDSSSSDPFFVKLRNVRMVNTKTQTCFEMLGFNENPGSFLHAFAIIRSRETALGLEVSTSYLKNGGYIDQYIEYRREKAQVDKVLADWGATGDAILKGSIAKK